MTGKPRSGRQHIESMRPGPISRHTHVLHMTRKVPFQDVATSTDLHHDRSSAGALPEDAWLDNGLGPRHHDARQHLPVAVREDHVPLPGAHHPVPRGIAQGQVRRAQREDEIRGLAHRQLGALVAPHALAQGAGRGGAARPREREHALAAGPGPGVREPHGEGRRPAPGAEPPLGALRDLHGPRGVGEASPEGELGRARVVKVGPARWRAHRHLRDGQLLHVLWRVHGHRQLPGRVVLAKQHRRQRLRATLAAVERVDDRGDSLLQVPQAQRPAVDEHHHRRLLKRGDGLHQLWLVAWQPAVGPVVLLSLLGTVDAYDQDHHICGLRCFHGGRDVVRAPRDSHSNHADSLAPGVSLTDRLDRGRNALVPVRGAPLAVVVAQHHLLALCVGAHHRQLEPPLEGQGAGVVLEQHDGLQGGLERELPVLGAIDPVDAVLGFVEVHLGLFWLEEAEAHLYLYQAAER
mmetsp:Transcript_95562/g.248850  ORF Transcript_95562/g.248850 Transcript_95562/m.248850 type:complete len:463 (-) Transcript_95562:1125-2513(-)